MHWYLLLDSHHPQQHKLDLIQTLKQWAQGIF